MAIKRLRRVPDGSSVLIKTDMSYLICVLNGLDTSKYDNKEYLDEYYCLLKNKNLYVNVIYYGDYKRTWYMLHKKMKEAYDSSLSKHFDKEIVIKGADAKKVNDKAK